MNLCKFIFSHEYGSSIFWIGYGLSSLVLNGLIYNLMYRYDDYANCIECANYTNYTNYTNYANCDKYYDMIDKIYDKNEFIIKMLIYFLLYQLAMFLINTFVNKYSTIKIIRVLNIVGIVYVLFVLFFDNLLWSYMFDNNFFLGYKCFTKHNNFTNLFYFIVQYYIIFDIVVVLLGILACLLCLSFVVFGIFLMVRPSKIKNN